MGTLQEHHSVLLELLTEFDRVCRKLNIRYILFAGSMLGAVRHGGIIPWDDDMDVIMLREDYERFLSEAPSELSDKYFLQKEFSEHWPMYFSKLRKNNTTCIEKYHPKDKEIHQGIYMDIFPCDSASVNSLVRNLQYFASRVVIAKSLYKRGYDTDSGLKKAFIAFCRLLPAKPMYRFAVRKNKGKSQLVHSFFAATSKYRKGVFPREWIEDSKEVSFDGLTVFIPKHYDEILTTLYGDYMNPPPEGDSRRKVHCILLDTEKNYTEYLNYVDGMTFDVYTRTIR